MNVLTSCHIELLCGHMNVLTSRHVELLCGHMNVLTSRHVELLCGHLKFCNSSVSELQLILLLQHVLNFFTQHDLTIGLLVHSCLELHIQNNLANKG